MNKLINGIFGFCAKKPVFYGLLGVFIVLNGLILKSVIYLKHLSGSMIPDIIPAHSAKMLYLIFTSYGPEGLAAYEKIAFYDMFYPACYALLFGAILYRYYKNTKSSYIILLPTVAAILDYIENCYLVSFAQNISEITVATATISGKLVLVKIIILFASVIFMISGMVAYKRKNL